MVWARAQKTGSPGAKALLLLLGELANDHSETYRDQTFIAEILEVSRETVSRNMKLLEKGGFVTLTKQFDKAGQRRPNLITLHVTNPHIDDLTPADPCDDSSLSPCDDSSQLYKHSLNKHSSTTDVVEEAPAPPEPVQDALIDAPARPKKSPNPARPEWEVAIWVSEGTNGAWTKHQLAPQVRWMLQDRGLTKKAAATLLRDMWRNGRQAPTRGNIGRIIDGLVAADGRGPVVDRKAEKIMNTLTMRLPGAPDPDGAPAITADPFQLRITS